VVKSREAIDEAFWSAERTTFGRVDDTGLDQVFVLVRESVEALFGLAVTHLRDHHGALEPGVAGDLAQRLFEHAADDVDADLDVAFGLQSLDGLRATEQRDAAAGNDAFLDAALVACMASSTRAFFSFISVSVAARP